MTTTRAPRSASFLITGRLARMRPSSVIAPLPDMSSGTFRSDRSRTRRPATSMSSIELMRYGPSRDATSAVRSTSRQE